MLAQMTERRASAKTNI